MTRGVGLGWAGLGCGVTPGAAGLDWAVVRPLVRYSAIADFGRSLDVTPGAVFGNCRFWAQP